MGKWSLQLHCKLFVLQFATKMIHFKKHGPGNENHKVIWREYLTNPLLAKPGAWAGGVKMALPDDFFDEKHFPTYDYRDIDRIIAENLKVEGWATENDYIKTNLYRWNETHFRSGRQGKVSIWC